MEDPNAALFSWSTAMFDASSRVTQVLSRLPLPDGPLHAWSLEILRWTSSATEAIQSARTKLGEAPTSASAEVASALRGTAAACLQLFNLYEDSIAALREAATDIAFGRATEIDAAATASIESLPWLLLEAQRVRFRASGMALGQQDLTRWLLLSRAHAYAIRRDLEELERQAEVGLWFEEDIGAVVTELAAMQNSIKRGQPIVEGKLHDPQALAEHPSAGDLYRSCRQSFETLEALRLTWSGIFAEVSSCISEDDKFCAVEKACAAFSQAEVELDRQLAHRADMLRVMR